MTITAAKVFFGNEGEWVDIIDAVILDADFSWNGSINGYGQDIHRVLDDVSVSIDFTMTKREHRRFTRNLARLCRRPALIHNGRKPR
jgi:hypothetical protein